MTLGLPRLGVGSRLLLAIVGAVALALVVSVTAFSVLLEQRLSSSATSLGRARAAAEASSLEIGNGGLIAPERPDEASAPSQVWIFSGTRALEAPRATAKLRDAARSLAGGPERSLDVGERTRLYALPVTDNGVRYGTVVSAVSLDPYEETARTSLVGAIALAALVLGAVTLLSRWMLGRALRPVSQMTEDAGAWSETDLDRRFDLGDPYDEITRLGATLDNLLERIAGTLRHEQRFTAELSHELRTPLARISGETELMLSRERTPEEYQIALRGIHRNAEQMTRTVDALVAAARREAGLAQITSDVRDAVEAAASTARLGRSSLDVRVVLPSAPVRVIAEPELVERMLGPLVDNAVRYGRTSVEVTAARNGSAVSIDVVDDGPGVDPAEAEGIFEPGARGRAATARADGAGLGLSLARRLARSAGGDVSVVPDDHGGHFSLVLPLAR
ncbi:MAG TPA: HAMP domain-containing sensor histidine kinase [Gaiella sp.]|nr:HAMP domain-containing sensor histidine kinase [Gaiella sp.]